MSTAPVTLDFSKAQSINQPVTLDFSKAQPVAGATQQTNQQPDDFEAQQEEAKRLVESGAGPAAAYTKPGQTATALSGMLTVGGGAGLVAGGLEAIGAATAPAAAKQVATGLVDELGNPIMRQQAIESVGKIPGILKASYDWAKANPVKAYLLYKVADEIGISPKGFKALFHLASGSAE